MNDCEKFYLEINQRALAVTAATMAVFTVFGGGWLIAVIFYALSLEVCGMNYLFVLHFSGNDNDALNFAKTLPVERSVFYHAYIKMLLLQSAVCAGVYALGTGIGRFTGITVPFLPRLFFDSGTLLSNIGAYALILCLVCAVITVMSGFVVKSSATTRSMLLIGTVYIPLVGVAGYLLLLELARLSPVTQLVHQIFAAAGVVSLCIMAFVMIFKIRKNHGKFVIK